MQLIRSKIVPAGQNDFWNELADEWKDQDPRSCLVLSGPIAEGSAEQQTLLKMLSACRLTPAQYHIFSIPPGRRVAWFKLRDTLQPQQVLLLGIDPKEIGIQAVFRNHEANRYDERVFIPSLSLSELELSPEAKKEFWAKGLKPVFVP